MYELYSWTCQNLLQNLLKPETIQAVVAWGSVTSFHCEQYPDRKSGSYQGLVHRDT